MTTPPNDLIPKPAIARELGVSSRTVSRWMEDHNLGFPTPIRVRGRLYFTRAALEDWKTRRIRASVAAE